MKKFWNKRLGVIAVLVAVALAPLMLQQTDSVQRSDSDEVLVVISPHNETIRNEFALAFNAYWQEKTGKKVFVDWRTPGGTSEIRLVLDNKFNGAKENEGIGIDVFFGGGEYIFEKMAKAGRFQKLEVFETHQTWFEGESGISQEFGGETFYSKQQLWVGVCLSQFGICYNVDGLQKLGLTPPTCWDDLGDPQYFGQIAMADPTKSGSVARAFEMLVQQKVQDSLEQTKLEPGETESLRRLRAIRYGWANGLNLIQKIAANTRYFTDSASKIPHDVAQGNAAAGMCIDFYGRSYNEKLKKTDGTSRLQWVAPLGGTSLSVDPVAVFRGAKNQTVAQGFVEFLLSERGQVLWNAKLGSRFGPQQRVLRRLPVRPAVYSKENVADFTDPEELPYKGDPQLVYKEEITGPVFGALRTIVKSMCIDSHKELQAAWVALAENDFPERALAHFHDVSYVSYDKTVGGISEQLQRKNKLEAIEMAKRMSGIFRRTYSEAIQLAEEEE